MNQKHYTSNSWPAVKWLTCCLFLLAGLWTANLNAQCTNTSSFGSAVAPTGATAVTISTCSFQGEYSTISSVVAGNRYVVTASAVGTYITMRFGTSAGQVVAAGITPLQFTAPCSGTYFAHWNTNSACGTASNCVTTTIACSSCGFVASQCTNTSAFGSGTAPSVLNTPLTLTTCAFAQEYSTINAVDPTRIYTVTGSVANTFLTVHQGTSGGPVVASGETPLTFSPTVAGTYFLHYNTNSACGTASSCITGTISYIGNSPCAFSPPTITSYTPNTNLCAGGGQTVTIVGTNFTGSTAVTFNGVNAGSFVVVNSTTITAVTPTGLTAGVINVTNPAGNVNSGAYTVVANPTVSVSPTSSSLCSPGGLAVALTASGTATAFAWSPATGLTPTTGNLVDALPTSSTTYTVTGSDANGCSATATSAIVVNKAPIGVTATATPSIVCSGDNAQLLATGQLVSVPNLYSFTQSSGTYTTIAGTVSSAAGDDGTESGLPIGFNFNYNGVTHTTFSLTTNGAITLTNSAFSGWWTNNLNTSNTNIIGALWDDNNQTGGSIQYATTGSVGSRVLTVQWDNIHIGGGGSSGSPTGSFQLKLYEGTNQIQIVYGTLNAFSSVSASIGITGAAGNFISVTPGPVATSSNAVANNSISSATDLPSGKTYTFAPLSPAFSWSPATYLSSSTIANPIASGVVANTTYTVTATDPSGCTATITTAISVNLVSANCSGANVSCFGGNNGTASVSGSGGTPGYTYLWSNSNTNSSISGLTAGTYCVTVTDAGGCTGTCCYTVTQPTAVTATAVATNASCPLCPDGTVSISSASGGTPGYTFTNLTGLLPGNYCITVTDANGCTTSACATVGAAGCTLNANASVTNNATCFGGNNGSATSAPTGGIIGPFTYSWSNGQTTATATGLSAGNYTVVISDLGSGCVTQGTVTITQPTALAANCSGTNVTCNGGNNGTVSVIGNGGTEFPSSSTVTYLMNDANTTPGFNIGCAPNTKAYATTWTGLDYGFTWTDGLSPSANITNISLEASFYLNCNGFNPRTVNLNTIPSGSIVPNGTACSGCASPLAVNAANLNSGIASYNKGGSNTIKLLLNFVNFEGLIANPAWSSSDNIYARVHVTSTNPGGGGYTYLWSNGSTNASVSGLAAGTYTVTITDANGCTATCVKVVTQPAAVVVTSSGTNVTGCSTSTNGSASVVGSNGVAPYTYLWNNSATTSSITGIGTGTYCVTVTDANGCTATSCYTVTGPSPLNIASAISNICVNGGSGNIDVTVTGGTPSSNTVYNFNNGLQGWTTDVAGSLCFTGTSGPSTWGNQGFGFSGASIGTTSVGGEHTYVQSPIISLPATLSLTAKSWSNNEPGYSYPSCTGYDVEYVEYSTDGGATWVPFFTTNQANLHGSNMAVWNTLSYTATITPTTNGRIRFRYDNADGCCGGTGVDNGWYLDDVTIAQPIGYNYLWSNGATTQDLTGVAAGTYTVTVTDANGCIKTAVYTVYDGTMNLSDTHVNADCQGTNSGSIDLTVSGGATPYAYAWSNGATTQDLSGLFVGIYNVTVTELNGCSAYHSVTIVDNPPLQTSETHFDVLCNGDLTGSIDITANDGKPAYSYLWNNGSTNEDRTGLGAGTYTVTVSDQCGSSQMLTITITQPTALSLTQVVSNVSCFGACNGSVSTTVSGGVAGYSYNWSNGASTSSIGNLCPGTYDLTVTDANGCTISGSYTIIEPAELFVNETHTDVSCYAGNNGSIDLTLTGGTPPFSFLWSNGATTEDLNSLTASTYFVTITQGNGCTAVASITINQPSVLALSSVNVSPTSGLPNSGSITTNVSGGVSGYTYLWNNGSTMASLSGLTAGTYVLTVTDANGCIQNLSVTLVLSCQLTATNIVVQNASCYRNNGIVTVVPSGGTTYTYLWNNGQTTATGTGLAYAFNSYCVITDPSSGCSFIDTVIVPHLTGLSVLLTSPVYAGGVNIRCFGGFDGAIMATVSGSPGPYTYQWSTGATTSAITGLSAGTYKVTVTNGGCKAISSITLIQSPNLVLVTSKTNAGCGIANGKASVTASGGAAPYTYSWNTAPVQTTAIATGLAAGTYTVTVGDANGCIKTASVTVGANTNLNVTGVTTNVSCFGGTNGTITLTVSGGANPYTYLWSNGSTTKNKGALAAGTYTVTVTSANGCVGTFSTTITQPTALVATAATIPVSCFGGNNGSATVTASGGTPGYTYLWNTVPIQTLANATGLKKATYTCTITDSKGCVKIVSVTIGSPAALTLSIAKTNVTNYGGNNGSASANAGGGVTPYSYLWSNGQTTQIAGSLTAGTYAVTVTDANGCTKSGTAVITQPAARLIGSTSVDEVNSVVFPNPTNGQITVSFDQAIQEKVTMEVYSMNGEVVFNKDLKVDGATNSFNIDLTDLPKGIYAIRYTTNEKQWMNKLVIK